MYVGWDDMYYGEHFVGISQAFKNPSVSVAQNTIPRCQHN